MLAADVIFMLAIILGKGLDTTKATIVVMLGLSYIKFIKKFTLLIDLLGLV